MDFSLRPLKKEELKYAYPQSLQLQGQTGSIGLLQGDFDLSGKGFHVNWVDYSVKFKNKEFINDVYYVIETLRGDYYGLLKNLDSMRDVTGSLGEKQEIGFRVDSREYSYLLRCNPLRGECNFYCYCYVKDCLNKHMENAKKGISFVNKWHKELFRIPDGDKICIVFNDGDKVERVCRYIDDNHTEIGNYLYVNREFPDKIGKSGGIYYPVDLEKENKNRAYER